MRPMRLRSHLAILVAATVVPVIALAVVLVVRGHESNQASVERGMRETVHAMAFAVDREVAVAFGRLELLATSRSIDARDWPRFREEAVATQLAGGSWVALTDLEGRQLVNTGLPPGVPPPPRRELESFRRTIATGKPAVSNLVVAQINGQRIVILNISVERDRAVRYVLSMTAPPAVVTQVLTAQRLPAGWYAVIYDENRAIIGRTRDEARAVGQRAAGDTSRETAGEGFVKTTSPEGEAVYFASTRVPSTPWRVGLGAPADVIDGALRRSLLLAFGGVILATLVAGAVATVLARKVARSIATLARAAEAVGRGEDFVPEPSSITEVNAASMSLHTAGLALQAHAREREAGEASARQLAAIVQSSDDAIVGKTLDGIITSWNPGATRTFGYTEAEAVGQSILLIVPPDRHDEEAGVLRRLRAGEVISHYETVRVDKAGRRMDISLTVSPIRDASGRVVGASKIARDVTERKRVEAERAALLARERAARAEADAANRAKDEFLAVISHELRTPLNAVYGWARMLQAGQIAGEDARRALATIVRNANAQVQLIDDLLDVSRIITGKMRLAVRPVDLRSVVEGALDTVRPAADAKAIRLQSVLDPRAAPITGDPDRLQQVVWNLLMNAVKFTPKGGRIQVLLQRINSHVEIVVSDTGQGIAADVLPFIFDRFRQADSSSTRHHAGLGVGLALVKHLVELQGGAVTAQSGGAGQGATFIVKLPVTIAEIPAGPVPRAHPTASSSELVAVGVRLDGLRVLVIDDDSDALDLASAILARAGAQVRTAISAADAMRLMQEWRPDVLVSDIEMPGEDGYALIRKVRALDPREGGRTPAVALTAYGRIEDRMRTLSAGYTMHVPKPVDPGELTTIIASVAGRTMGC
jgi:PAS domain S-box-containing protein